jgi:hypothetical protein
MDTANPALSSEGEVIFDPDERRWSDCASMFDECIKSVEVLCAWRFVLITITTYSFRESPREGHFYLRNIHVAGVSFNGRNTVYPRRL